MIEKYFFKIFQNTRKPLHISSYSYYILIDIYRILLFYDDLLATVDVDALLELRIEN